MPKTDYILAIESSCDDTSVAILTPDYQIISQMTSSQPEHNDFGGILPELASRLHMKNILILTENVLKKSNLTPGDLTAVAVSINPGLIGSLIVGLSFAKSYAWSLGIPLITVNHMLGHVFANHLEHPDIQTPYLALVVSGGHTELVLFETDIEFRLVGKTLDDAAGETFDKSAKLMKLGFPGGPVIDKLAKEGNPDFVIFPRALKQKDNFNFSYSGLKTSILQYLVQQTPEFIEAHKPDLAASIQIAIVEPLVTKTIRYARLNNIKTILIGGGVAANSLLRSLMTKKANALGIKVHYPPISLCMDNAAMIAAAAIPKFKHQQFAPLSVNAFSEKGTRFI
jgi:N6-L-threonylcarbamoyladenine synthase